MKFEGVDFGPAVDVDALVWRQLLFGLPDTLKREDRTTLDWLQRAYQHALSQAPSVADRISCAIGRSLGRGEPTVDSLVCRFFSNWSTAPGGELLQDAVSKRLTSWDPALPDPIPGGVSPTLRGALVRAALRWRADDPLPVAARDAARAEVLVGGRAWDLLGPLWLRDRAWVEAHLGAILVATPRAAAPAFTQRVLFGEEPEVALRTVLALVPAIDPHEMAMHARLRVQDPSVLARVLATIDAHPRL